MSEKGAVADCELRQRKRKRGLLSINNNREGEVGSFEDDTNNNDLKDKDPEIEGFLKRWIEKIPWEKHLKIDDVTGDDDEIEVEKEVVVAPVEKKDHDDTQNQPQSRSHHRVHQRIPKNAMKFERRDETRQPTPVPWGAGCLATFLFVIGTFLLWIIMKRMWESFDDLFDRVGALLILTVMTLLPGIYNLRLFVYAYFEIEGSLKFHEIPQFN